MVASGLVTRLVAGLVLGLLATSAQAGPERFVVDLASEPSTLDPQVQWNPDSYFVYRNIFDNLVTRDDKGAIVPEIATAWRQVSDTRLEFDLRNDVSFHDGSKLTADDVVFSIKRITDPKFGSPQLSQFSKIADAVADGPAKVVVTLKTPYPAMLAQMVKLSIVPKHVVESVGNDAFNLKPVGSGPYRFVSWDRGVAVTLARNDAYWGRKGPFPTAVFRAVPNAATRLADVQANAADVARAIDSDQAKQLEEPGRGKRLYALTERAAYLRINSTKPPFDKLPVRQALSYAIDKEGITEGILGGLDKPIDEMPTPAHFGFSGGI
jgi:peptide/nickel transport system substrate-binding protein